MALYAKAAGGNWSSAGTWSTTGSGGGDSSGPPTASDNVIFESGSGAVTIDATALARSVDCTAGTGDYAGTLTHNSAINLAIGDGTAGASNVALKFSAGMTYTKGSTTTSSISFVSTSATQQTITLAGKVLGNTTQSGAGSSYLLSDAFAANGTTSTTLTITHGTFNSGNQTIAVGTFNSNAATVRTVTLGTSTLTVNSINLTTTTNLTFSAASSTFNCASTFTGGGLTYGTVNLAQTSGTLTVNGANSYGTLTLTGPASKTAIFSMAADQTVSGTFTVNGNSVTNRVKLQSSVEGTARTITAATVAASHVDIQDITGAGAGSWNLSAITGNSGDCGGNSGITFTTAATQTATGTASFSWSTHGWTSRVPLPQDDVIVNNAFIAGRTVTTDMPRWGKNITFGCTGSPALSNSIAGTIYGSLDLTGVASTAGGGTLVFESSGSSSITTVGLSIPWSFTFNRPGNTYTLQDALSMTVGITLNYGTFDANDFNVTATFFSSNNSDTRILNMGNGTWTLTNTGSIWTTAVITGFTLNPEGSTIVVNNATATSKTFAGGGLTYNNLTVSGDNVIISGANTFNTLAVNTAGLANGLKLTVSIIQTITSLTTNGSVGNLAKLVSTTGGTQATIKKAASGVIVTDYMSIQDIALSTVNSPNWYAGANSTNVSGNTNITFAAQTYAPQPPNAVGIPLAIMCM